MIIGVSGKAQSGKNTVCQMIAYIIWYYNYSQRLSLFGIEHYNICMSDYSKLLYEIGWDQVPFAGKLKQCLSCILDTDAINFEDNEFKKSNIDWLGITVRELLQKFGTAIRNEVCDDFWVKACLVNYEGDWLIPDVRFKSEVRGITDKGGIILRVNREGAGAGNHISEIDLDNYQFNYVIDNNGSLEDLLFKVKELVTKLGLIYDNKN